MSSFSGSRKCRQDRFVEKTPLVGAGSVSSAGLPVDAWLGYSGFFFGVSVAGAAGVSSGSAISEGSSWLAGRT